ncbi:MAG TPA: DoxX family protein [Bacteroidia bacterium]|nr:DoxX family protein [Bacteroidia bacterium]
MNQFLKSEADYAPLITRLTIAIVMWPHGAQLLLGWFDGFGFEATMNYFTSTAGLPWVVGLMVILIQFFGAVFIATGTLTRFWALAMFIIGVGMIFSGHKEHGFFMNWFGNQQGEGYEFHLLLLGLCASLLISGSGKWGVDRLILKGTRKLSSL